MSSKYTTTIGITIGTFAAAYAAHYILTKVILGAFSRQRQDKGPTARIFATKDDVAAELCAFVVERAKVAIVTRGVFYFAVAGGSLLDLLSQLESYKDAIDFSKVVLVFANHKCVPPDHEKATARKCQTKFAQAAGITKIILPSASPVDGGNGSAEAIYYAQALVDAGVPHDDDSFPLLDLILLGLGADGHVGSCHPMGPAVAEQSLSVVGSPKEGEQPSSITLTIPAINRARHIAVVVCGGSKGKKEAVARAMIRPAETPPGAFPAQLLKSPVFFLDTEAADDL